MLYTPAFVALFIANLTTVASFSVFFLFPLFITARGGGQGDIGIIMGTFALASAICRPWISDMIDRLGRKRSYTIGCLILTGLPLCYLLLPGDLSSIYLPLLLLRTLHGVGLAICFTAVFTFIADLIPPARLNEGIGMFGVSGLIGLALGPLAAEAVLEHFGFSWYFITASGLAGIGLLIQLPLVDAYTPSPHRTPSFFCLLGQRKNLVVALLAVLFGIGVAAATNFVTPLATERRIGLIAIFYIAYSTAAVVVRFAGGRLADRVGENRILPYAYLVTASGLFLLSFSAGQGGLALAGVLAGSGHGLIFPTLNSLAIRDEPPELRGKITGIFTGGIDSGVFLGSLMLGLVGEAFGLQALFVLAGFCLVSALAVFRFQVRKQQSPHPIDGG